MKSRLNGVRVLVAFTALLLSVLAHPQQPHAPGVEPIGVDATTAQMEAAVSNARAGRKLLPAHWPYGARVAVCISFDIDNESLWRLNPLPVPLSEGEYGALEAMPRILALLDRHKIPATFFIPVMSATLHPQMIGDIQQRGRHEIGVHGWVHEESSTIGDSVKEEQLLNNSIAFLTHALGKRPVGFRAPSWDFSQYTLRAGAQGWLSLRQQHDGNG